VMEIWMIKIRPASVESIFEDWPEHWPKKEHYVSQHDVTEEQYFEFESLVNGKVSETEVEKYFARNPEVLALTAFLFSTGHHATWIYPKLELRPSAGDAKGGMIPDYVISGANSDGLQWFILELKGPRQNAFVHKGKRVYLSADSNKGICQLISYIDIASKSQAYLRDELGLKGFREPRGIILIGTEEESEAEMVREFKAAWNRMHPNVQVISYSRLLRKLKQKVFPNYG
ncbi:TPA: Shedu anti-phage system protein SduA domain-containing protein, partial [Vibrio cholerae]